MPQACLLQEESFLDVSYKDVFRWKNCPHEISQEEETDEVCFQHVMLQEFTAAVFIARLDKVGEFFFSVFQLQ